jgi:flavin reductase (DIM6/NTAB) family NADH-FMN oxidoreductase RutF
VASDETEFTKLVSQLDYSLFIVTTAAHGERAGCLIGFASQVSIDPPRFLAGLSTKNRTFRIAREAEVLIIHFVPEQAEELATLFGGETGDDIDKFERCRWREGPKRAPILEDLENWFAGKILERIDLGDHWGFVLEPIAGEVGRSSSPLTFRRAKWIEPGHEP